LRALIAALLAWARIRLGPSSWTSFGLPAGSPVCAGDADSLAVTSADGDSPDPESDEPEHPATTPSTSTPATAVATRIAPLASMRGTVPLTRYRARAGNARDPHPLPR